PEYGWDDYKDVDVRNKTLLMLIGDPPLPDPKDPSKLDDKMFKGKAMTYYGRWTYKYEIAAEKGAAAAIIIHETEPAAYPWQVVKSSWGKENFELDNPNKNMDAVSARCWITLDVARRLLADCGQNFDGVKKSAVTKDFQPVTLNAKANIEIKQQIRSFKSHNVVGNLEGSDSKLRDEYIIYTAHWDHLGRHPELQGDQIFHSAIPDSRPDKGKIYRADNFEFSKVGLPSLYIGKGEHLLSRPETAPLRSDEFDSTDYHQVTDEIRPDWDLSGAVQDVQLLFEVGYQVANGDKFPEWKPRSEFKAKRDSMLKSSRSQP